MKHPRMISAMKHRRASRSKNGRRSGPKPCIRAVTKRFCCWCNQEVAEGEAWAGDIAGALAFGQIMHPPLRANQTALCLSCGTDRLPRFLQAANEGNPTLRLGFPGPEMFRTSTDPIPNIWACGTFFSTCRSTTSGTQLADLLLEFESNYPVEWSYSGWKNDFIADLVLGRWGAQQRSQKKKSAEYWLKEHWKLTKDSPETDSKKRAFWAAIELDSLKTTRRTPKPTLAARQGIPRPEGDHFLEAFAKGLSHNVAEGSTDSAASNPSDEYKKFAVFIRWLWKHWHELCAKKRGIPLHENAADKFVSEINTPVERSVLVELAAAYDNCYKLPKGDKNEHLPSVHEVLLTFVAERHGISTTLVAHERARLHKKNARS